MARVLIASQAWGWLVQVTPINANGVQVDASVPLPFTQATISNLDGSAADTWSLETGGSVAHHPSSDASGLLPGWIEAGSYDQTVLGIERRVEALSSADIAALQSIPIIAPAPTGVTAVDGPALTAAFAAAVARSSNLVLLRGGE